ncbi:GNAT family N-acetyltransferase [Paenalcaligenes niemegkensis]|uniref:GNAT family N-acetyltransferase n=1 Tax=Paenalcaligenes niemegkensis TaxID=2895469 RepID=UPI001EE8B21B|nr:GNAT family N-acetyltransferase [Paenalcaligenes niemegkensis]MCQ9616084.1 GNAT family N-acetyltransferase [Paenalcaligenes niemegkensis]
MQVVTTLKTGSWNELGTDAMQVRNPVFVIEQNVPVEQEIDNDDAVSLHAVIYNEHGEPVATGRLLPDGHIGRMAVLENYRRLGLGARLLLGLTDEARRRGLMEVIVSAQVYACAFYEKAGFTVVGEPYIEVGIKHVRMRRALTM